MSEQMEEKKSKQKNLKKEILSYGIILLTCFSIVTIFTTFFWKPVKIDGSSMYPTLENAEIGLTSVFDVQSQGIQRFDIVIIYRPDSNEYWVKRVIGLPYEKIKVSNDQLYINGERIQEFFLDTDYVKSIRAKGEIFTSGFDEVTLGEDEYFIMGDNRIVSLDSRKKEVGPIKKEHIIGKNIFILYPFSDLKMVNGSK